MELSVAAYKTDSVWLQPGRKRKDKTAGRGARQSQRVLTLHENAKPLNRYLTIPTPAYPWCYCCPPPLCNVPVRQAIGSLVLMANSDMQQNAATPSVEQRNLAAATNMGETPVSSLFHADFANLSNRFNQTAVTCSTDKRPFLD